MLLYLVQALCLIFPCLQKNPEVKVVNEFDDGVSGLRRVGRSGVYMDNNEIPPMNMTEPPRVLTSYGWVEGYFQKSIQGRPVAAFEGIRYAYAPRFKEPIPSLPWKGVFKAVKKAPSCLQTDMTQFMRVHGAEDCLFLSIFTPMIPNSDDTEETYTKQKGLPVMIFIHGGGFLSGTSSEFGPAYLLTKKIVLVSINYRLGPLGFLSTGDKYGSGNWGMKDQVMAMKWVKSEISRFGGDPDKVTLFGQSAGAASVGLHIVSKQTNGLFHRAICQSGSSLTNWAIQNDTIANSKKLATLLRCPSSDSKSMMSCLRRRDPNWIVGAFGNSMETWKVVMVTKLNWGPIIENPSREAFLEEAPEVTYLEGRAKKLPLIIGANEEEGSIFALSIILFPGMMRRFNRHWDTVLPFSIGFDKRTNEPGKISKRIKDFYLNGDDLSFWNRKRWIQMIGDRLIMQGTMQGMKYHSAIAPTYGYYFTHQGGSSLISATDLVNRFSGLEIPRKWRPTHGDEMTYLMNSTSYAPIVYGSKDYAISEFLVNLWTNFAESGEPYYNNEDGGKLPIWKPINAESQSEIKLLEINENPQMRPLPDQLENRLKFWEKLKLKDDHAYPVTFT